MRAAISSAVRSDRSSGDDQIATTGLGPTIRLTGHVAQDMDRIRAFYAGKTGVRPGLGSEPRLADESGLPDVA